MTMALDTMLVLLILTTLLLLGSSRLGFCIRIVALQGVMAGLLPLITAGSNLEPRPLAVGLLVVGLKGFLFPRLLLRALRESDTSREAKPFVGYAASLAFGVLALLASFWLDARFNLPMHASSDLVVPVAFSTMAAGLFLIVARRTAVNQVIGYLTLENGIYAFGLAIVPEVPALIELAVLMDVFVGVFVMGIAIYHINLEFDHIDSDRLNTLKG